MNESLVAGIDIGGSHITVVLIHMKEKSVLEQTRTRMPIQSGAPAHSIIQEWSAAIQKSFEGFEINDAKLAIAMPGPFDYEKGVSYMQDQNKYDALYGLNVKALLAAELGITPAQISFANDAACFLQGELVFGAAKSKTPAIGLTLGTGLGSAWAGNNWATDANLWCAPFKDGIAEDYLSARWLIRQYETLSGKRLDNVKSMLLDDTTGVLVQKVFETFGENLAAFLSPYINNENIGLVVIGGSIAQSFVLFEYSLQRELNRRSIKVDVCQSKLGENASMLGAAAFSQRNLMQV